MPESLEQTLVLIKPDALKLSLTGYIMSTLSEPHTGLRLAGTKIVHVSRMLASEHYAEHAAKPFFSGLVDYLMGKLHYPDAPERRRVVALVYCGEGAVPRIRNVTGPTNPHVARDKAPGTIRSLGTILIGHDAAGKEVIDRIDNLVHASANLADAEREIKLWFRPNDLMPYMRAYPVEICGEHYYLKDGKLATSYSPGAYCILVPGDPAWKTDLDALRALLAGSPSLVSLGSVVAKYMMNNGPET